jgi:hypothetical protein
MVVPDLALICEIMLMAEGFQMSKILSRKFVILYKLCEDLLSKSRHYDWKLRAIKTTLYVAGGMKRAAPELSEDKVGGRVGVGLDSIASRPPLRPGTGLNYMKSPRSRSVGIVPR